MAAATASIISQRTRDMPRRAPMPRTGHISFLPRWRLNYHGSSEAMKSSRADIFFRMPPPHHHAFTALRSPWLRWRTRLRVFYPAPTSEQPLTRAGEWILRSERRPFSHRCVRRYLYGSGTMANVAPTSTSEKSSPNAKSRRADPAL